MHEAARTIIMQTHAAAPAVAGAHTVSYQTWLITMLVPMWVGVRLMSRTWAMAMGLGARHRRATEQVSSGQNGDAPADQDACGPVRAPLT